MTRSPLAASCSLSFNLQFQLGDTHPERDQVAMMGPVLVPAM